MKELILELLEELKNVPEIKSKIYIIETFKGYILNSPTEVIEGILTKIAQLSEKDFHKEIWKLFDSGSFYTIKTGIDIYNQLDDVNKHVIWDYHNTLTSFLLKLKKEQ